MQRESLVIEREALYEEVWSTPMRKLAEQYGISDRGLAKICTKLHVPRPGRGYWAKLRHGKMVRQTPLPLLKKGQSTEHTLIPEARRYRSVRKKDDPRTQEVLAEVHSIDLRVRDTLHDSHPLVRKTSQVLRNASTGWRTPTLKNYRNAYLDVRVTKTSLQGALRIMNVILKGFEQLGYQIEILDTAESVVRIKGESIRFGIRERSAQVRIDESQNDHRKWKLVGSGDLRIIIDEWGLEGIRKTFADGKTQRVEDLIETFIVTCILAVDVKKERRRKREEEERQWQYKQEKARARSAVYQQCERHNEDLQTLHTQWRQCQQLRELVTAVEAKVQSRTVSREEFDQFLEWKAWVEQFIEEHDPLGTSLPYQRDAYIQMNKSIAEFQKTYEESPFSTDENDSGLSASFLI